MSKRISAFIALAFAAIFMNGCGAGGERNAKDASSLQKRLDAAEKKNEEYETRIAELEAQQSHKKKTKTRKTRTSRRRSVFGSNTATPPEREAEESPSEAEPPARATMPVRRSAVDPRACGGIGPGVGRVFANVRAAKAYAEMIACNGMCQFLTNRSGSWMSVQINNHAVTLCNDSEPSFPIPVYRKVGRDGLPELISTAPPGFVVVLGKFFRPTSFHVELYDQVGPGPYKTLFVKDFGEAFPNRRAGPNGYLMPITPGEMRTSR